MPAAVIVLGEVFWHETLLRYSVAILKEKGNKVSQHLLPRKEKTAACAAKPVVLATLFISFCRTPRMAPLERKEVEYYSAAKLEGEGGVGKRSFAARYFPRFSALGRKASIWPNVLSGLATQPQRNFFLDIETRFCADVL
jgi:hypothetical protein